MGLACQSQSLGKKRIKKLEQSVVKILIDNNQVGTGFVVSEKGLIATCFHVIEPAFIRDADNNEIVDIKNIVAKFEDKSQVEIFVLEQFLYDDEWYEKGLVGDYIALSPINSLKGFEFLKLGKWADIDEGEIVYTSGYPQRRNERISAIGMFSTKYLRQIKPNYSKNDSTYTVDAARLDVTVNNGNSGGPLIRLGKNSKKDLVVGLISFKLNPNGNQFAEYSKAFYNWANDTSITKTSEMKDIKLSLAFLYNAAANNSLGVSGAVPTDGLVELLETLNQ